MGIRQRGQKTLPIPASLDQDLIIELEWDAPTTGVLRGCKLIEAPAGGAARTLADVQLAPDAQGFVFHLTKGSRLSVPLTAELVIDPPPTTAVTAAIPSASAVVPEREAISTVYGEQNQELRRMRTLYESYLVVVTGSFATLVSKADAIVGAPHRKWMALVLALLTAIVIYLMWQVAKRYARTSKSIKNLETALGLRTGALPWPLMVDSAPRIPRWQYWKSFWNDDNRGHTVWAMWLIGYTLALGGLAALFLWGTSRTDASSAPAQPGQVVQTIQLMQNAPVADGKQNSSTVPPVAPATVPGGKGKKASGH